MNTHTHRISGLAAFAAAGLLFSASPASAETTDGSVSANVRARTPEFAVLLNEGMRESATFRRIVEAIDKTNGLVMVSDGKCGHGVRACLPHRISVSDGTRYLWIVVDGTKDTTDLLGSIAHELRHSLEVLSNASVTTTEGMVMVYMREGFRANGGNYETHAAIDAGTSVREEVRASRKHRN